MKILLTGANGFLGKHFKQKLNKYTIVSTTRKELDLCNTEQTDLFFKSNNFDVVIHCAINGGNRLLEETPECFRNNLLMALNLQKNKSSFKKLLHFGSGAELDRKYNISGFENNIWNRIPNDFYGLSKNIIARIFDKEPNFYNLRLFNVFSEDEAPRRMIKSNIINYIEEKPIIIHQDKMMDFFYIDDLINVLELYIENKCFIKEVDCVYKNKTSLRDVAFIINNLSNNKVPIILNSEIQGNDYTGNYCEYFNKLNFFGLQYGIEKVYKSLI